MRSDQLPDDLPLGELLTIYLRSSRDSLDRIEGALAGECDLALVLRLSHNLKGSSLQFGFLETGEVGRAMEDLAGRLLRKAGAPSAEDIAAFQEAVRLVRESLRSIEEDTPPPDRTRICRLLEERGR